MNFPRLLGIFQYVSLIAVGLIWYFLFAPIQLGGPLAFIRVDGVSMEPTYFRGDLIVASSIVEPDIGKAAVFLVQDDVPIVHRIVEGSAANGWKTKGDNLDQLDPWTVPDGAIIGVVEFVVPGGADVLLIATDYPLQFGLALGALAATTYIPIRRKKYAPELRLALQTAIKEPRRDGRTNTDYVILISSSFATMAALVVTVALYSSKTGFSSGGWASLAGLVISGIFTLVIVYRLYDGRFAKEPASSLFALSGRLMLVKDFPSLRTAPRVARSAVAIRTVAEKYRLPILHRIDPSTGEHSFLLILLDGSSVYWKPARHRESKSANLLG